MKKQQEIGKKSGLQRSKNFNLELTNIIISMFVNMTELFFQSATKPCELELCRLRALLTAIKRAVFTGSSTNSETLNPKFYELLDQFEEFLILVMG